MYFAPAMDNKCDPLSETLITAGVIMGSIVISLSIFTNLLLTFIIFSDPKLRKRSNFYLGFFTNIYDRIFNNVFINITVSVFFAAILCIPFPIIYSNREKTCINSNYENYTVNICDYDHSNIGLSRWSFIIETILVFIFPIITMLILYTKILIFIRKTNKSNSISSHRRTTSSNKTYQNSDSKSIQTNPTLSHNSSTHKSKNPKTKLRFSRGLVTALIIIVFYVVTWSPFVVVRIISLINKNISSVVVRSVQFVFLIYLCFYPLIYIGSNPKIKNSLIRKIRCCGILKKRHSFSID
ncbi:hypothetical protein MXB_701 [Myxobolus squamalis]|nr:hypothetical protein MXB_701 [Myxobolus squamalis]